MKKTVAKRLQVGDKIEFRFSVNDTFTPGKWETGVVEVSPIEISGNVFVSIMLDDGGIFLSRVKCSMLRKPKYPITLFSNKR